MRVLRRDCSCAPDSYRHGSQPRQLQSRLATWTTAVSPRNLDNYSHAGPPPNLDNYSHAGPPVVWRCTAPCCDASLTELRDVALSSPADAGRSMAPPSRTGMLRDFSTADVGRLSLPACLGTMDHIDSCVARETPWPCSRPACLRSRCGATCRRQPEPRCLVGVREILLRLMASAFGCLGRQPRTFRPV